MKKLLCLLLLIPSLLFAATGDITVKIRPDGWTAEVTTAGFTTGATYAFKMRGRLIGTITGTFTDGETITQATTGATAVVVGTQSGGTELLVETPAGTPNATNNWTGAAATLVTDQINITDYNIPGPTTPYFTVVSEGYNNAGTLGTVTRTVYLTSVVRVPYDTKTQPGGTWGGTFVDGETITCSTSGATATVVGDQSAGASLRFKSLSGTPLTTQTWTGGTSAATFVNTSSTVTTLAAAAKDARDTGSALVTLVALSDYIYNDDNTGAGKSGTAPTVTIPAAFITNTGGASQTSNALTAAAVTQNSAAPYSAIPVQAAWAWPPYQKYDATSKLRVAAYHRDGREGKPVAAVKFTVTDTSAHTYTETVTVPTIDASMGDAEPVLEYVTTGDITTGLTQGETLTATFVAYPWVGDASAICDATAIGGTIPLLGTITGVNDKAGTYGVTCALVDDVAGSDAGALTVYDAATFNPATAYKFLTIAKAARAIRDYNNTNRSRDRVDAGIIYCNAGTYVWMGATISGGYGTTASTWVTVKPAAGVARADVVIDATSGNTDMGDRVKLENITLTSATSNTFSGCLAMWLDNCTINSTGTALWNDNLQNVWLTRCTIPNCDQGLISPQNAVTQAFPLVRGCDLTSFDKTIHCYTVIGNKSAGNSTSSVFFKDNLTNTMSLAPPTNVIFAHNRMKGWANTTGTMVNFCATSKIATRGYAVVNNLLEAYGSGSTATIMDIGSSEGVTTDSPADNVICWHNTLVGVRNNDAYNSSGSTIKYRRYWSFKNNLFYDWNIKTDDFASDPNGARVGNWPVLYGVGFSGNVMADDSNGFDCEWDGLAGINPRWGPTSTADVYFRYVNYLAANEGTAGTGGGDYRLKTTASAYRMARDYLIPYGLGGKPRSANGDSAGAYSEGGVRPASMFFAN